MLATHDSLSSYPVKYFFLKPFNFMAGCQAKNLTEQYMDGARSFDLRFAKHRGKWYGAHGMQIYDITLEKSLDILMNLSRQEPLYFRVLCEDTFYKKSDYNELYKEIIRYLSGKNHHLKLLYAGSKRDWNNRINTKFVNETENYDTYPMMGNDRKNLCLRVARMYELETADDKINFIGCYESSGIPRLLGLPFPKIAANALTPIAKTKKWKENDCPVVDFI